MGDDETTSESVVEVRSGRLSEAQRRELFVSRAAAELSEIDLDARQAAIGERRRYVGPVFEDVAVPVAFSGAADAEVEPTEVAPPPEVDEDESESDEE